VLGRIEPQGLDVSQQGDPLVQPCPDPDDRADRRDELVDEGWRIVGRLVPVGHRLGLPDRQVHGLHGVVEADLEPPLQAGFTVSDLVFLLMRSFALSGFAFTRAVRRTRGLAARCEDQNKACDRRLM
jgi:hypothetical protein